MNFLHVVGEQVFICGGVVLLTDILSCQKGVGRGVRRLGFEEMALISIAAP